VLVIGGGDSAVEAALSLSEQKGCEVSLSYRNKAFGRIRERNEERITQAMRDGAVRVYLESQVQEIRREEVLLSCENRSSVIANDFVFVFIGGVLPTEFLKQVGISIQKKYGER
jgi:thioredoxin reductase